NIYFKNLIEADLKHIHFEEVSLRVNTEDKFGTARYYISDNRGYVLYTTAVAETVKEAQEKVYSLTEKVIIPKMMYRNDIGSRFIKEQESLLKKWGYLL
ncbi:MAG: phosphoribosylglycinamide synthetase C domain-containing protein, partial [bacterium]